MERGEGGRNVREIESECVSERERVGESEREEHVAYPIEL